MSGWQAYADGIKGAPAAPVNESGYVIGVQGGVWAQAGNALQSGEDAAIAALSNAGGKVNIAGESYMVLRKDEMDGLTVYFLKLGADKGGAIYKSTQAICVGIYGKGQSSGSSSEAAYKMAKALNDAGY